MRRFFIISTILVVFVSCKKDKEDAVSLRNPFFNLSKITVSDAFSIQIVNSGWHGDVYYNECFKWIDLEVKYSTNIKTGYYFNVYAKNNIYYKLIYSSDTLFESSEMPLFHTMKIDHTMLEPYSDDYTFKVVGFDVLSGEDYDVYGYVENETETPVCFDVSGEAEFYEFGVAGTDLDDNAYFSLLENANVTLRAFEPVVDRYKIQFVSYDDSKNIVAETEYFNSAFVESIEKKGVYYQSIELPISIKNMVTYPTRLKAVLFSEKDQMELDVSSTNSFNSYYQFGIETAEQDLPFEVLNVSWKNSIDNDGDLYDSYRELVIITKNKDVRYEPTVSVSTTAFGGYNKHLTNFNILSDTVVIPIFGSNILEKGYYDFDLTFYNTGLSIFTISEDHLQVLNDQKFETETEDGL